MAETTNIPDQEDILATNERLQADNTRLTGELQAANELLETAQADLTTATDRSAQLAERVSVLEAEAEKLKIRNGQLAAQMADFNKAVAAEVLKLGLNPNAAEHKEAPVEADLTPTQRVLAAKGVSSIADLNRKQ